MEMGRNVVLSTGSTTVAIVATIVGAVAVATPYWATFENRLGKYRAELGRTVATRAVDGLVMNTGTYAVAF